MRNLHILAATLALCAGIAESTTYRCAPTGPTVKRRQRPAFVIDEAKRHDIAEHNAAVDQRNAEKQARKAARMIKGPNEK